EDGIRDDLVTGVQTCALPICSHGDIIAASGVVVCKSGSVSITAMPIDEKRELLNKSLRHLRGSVFRWQRYRQLAPDWNHDHCQEIGRASCRERGTKLGADDAM